MRKNVAWTLIAAGVLLTAQGVVNALAPMHRGVPRIVYFIPGPCMMLGGYNLLRSTRGRCIESPTTTPAGS